MSNLCEVLLKDGIFTDLIIENCEIFPKLRKSGRNNMNDCLLHFLMKRFLTAFVFFLLTAGDMLRCIQGGLSPHHPQRHRNSRACQHWPPRNQRCVWTVYICLCLLHCTVSSVDFIRTLILHWLDSDTIWTCTSAYICPTMPRQQLLLVSARHESLGRWRGCHRSWLGTFKRTGELPIWEHLFSLSKPTGTAVSAIVNCQVEECHQP